MRARTILSLTLALALASALGTRPVGAAGGTPQGRDYGLFLNILPSGQGDSVNTAQALGFETTGRYPAHFLDQLAMYRSLPTARVTDANLSDFFKYASLGVAARDVERVERPAPGVTIRWDRWGVPHIDGRTRGDAMFGVGYASAENRLFMMDVLRHVGRGRVSQFLGPSEDNFEIDQAIYLAAGYSESELRAQVLRLRRFGAVGRQIIEDGRRYIGGVNARIEEVRADPSMLPAEYPALQIVPNPWRATDLVAVATVIQATFAGGGGNELLNAMFLQQAEHRLGTRAGVALFDDLREREDPEAPTTADGRFPFGKQRPVDPRAVAVPDPGSVSVYDPLETTPGSGAGGSASAPEMARLNPLLAVHQALARGGLPMPDGMSNWLAVNADRTKAGHPIAVMGPQVGYFIPQVLMEMDVHAPGLDARGATFPGVSLYILLGRGPDFAWSATSGESDETDVRAEELCNPEGGKPGPQSTSYMYRGRCVHMNVRTDRWVAKPTAGGPGLPTLVQAHVERTVHGPVIARATVDGKPVAYVSQRSTFGGELDSAVSFYLLNSDAVRDAGSFMRAMSYETGSFNWLYVDHRDVAYYHSGLYPIRARGVDTDLPSWGTGQWEWQGYLPASRHPQAIDPAKGWIDSWNNKPAPAWESSDASYNFGPVHRVQMLAGRLARRVPQGGVTPADLAAIMADAATVDLRGQEVLPYLLQILGRDPQLQPYLDILRQWTRTGAHRIDRDGDRQYDDQAAVALMDAWWAPLVLRVFGAEMHGLFRSWPMELDDENRRLGLGSSFQDGYYGYVQKAVRMALGNPVARPYRELKCGDGTLRGCRAAIRQSLLKAISRLGPDPSKWNASEAGDAIVYTPIGLIALRDQPWQNRPTFQQVVQVTGHR